MTSKDKRTQLIVDGNVTREKSDSRQVRNLEYRPALPGYVEIVSATYDNPGSFDQSFVARELFRVTDQEGNFPHTAINVQKYGSMWNYGISAEKPWEPVGQNSSSTVSIYGYGPRVAATDHGAKKHPTDGQFAVNKKIESEPAHHAVRDAILRAMNDGKVTPAEAKQLENLRVMVTKHALNDGKFDERETQEIVNLAKAIAPGAEAKARALKEMANR